MALSTCCRNALVSVSVVLLLGGGAAMLWMGILDIDFGTEDDHDAEMRKYNLKVGIILLVFGVVALVAIPLILWLCCCFRQRAPKWLFILGLVVTDVALVAGFVCMLMFGAGFLMSPNGALWRGALLVSFSVIPLAAAIGIPIYCTCRRKRQIREEEEEERMNEGIAPNSTETTLPVAPLNDGKVLV